MPDPKPHNNGLVVIALGIPAQTGSANKYSVCLTIYTSQSALRVSLIQRFNSSCSSAADGQAVDA